MSVAANQRMKTRNPGGLIPGPVLTGIHLYQGTMAFAVAASGYITDDDAGGANHFMGIVKDECDNSAGASGDLNCELYTTGEYELVGASLTQAMVGDKAYATDNYVVTPTSTTATLIGRFTEFISSTRMMVKLEIGLQA